MTAPRVSVVVPTRDRPEALARCLVALERAAPPAGGFEVVVVDDGSRRPPRESVAAVTAVPVTLVERAAGGPAAARNAGVAVARGDVVAFTDDDCAPEPEWLRRVVARLDEAGRSAAAGGPVVNALPANPWAAATAAVFAAVLEPATDGAGGAGLLLTANLALPREAFDAAGGFDERLRRAAGEDRDLCDRLRRRGIPLLYDPAARVVHHHDLDAGGLWRQHRAYGRATVRLRRLRAAADEPIDGRQAGVHQALLRRLGDELPGRPDVAAAIGLTQAAYAAGMAEESLRARLDRWPLSRTTASRRRGTRR